MDVEFADEDLRRLEVDPRFTAGYGQEIVRGFRKVLFSLRNCYDERDLYANRGLNFEKLKGARAHQFSARINKQWRLIFELEGAVPNKKIRVMGIEDYH
jgi:proteic killer suppression protein